MSLLNYRGFVSEKLNIQPIGRGHLVSNNSDVSLNLLENIRLKMHALIHQFEQRVGTFEERCSSNINTAEYDKSLKMNVLKIMYVTFGKTDPKLLAENIFKYLSLRIKSYDKIKHNILLKIYTGDWNDYMLKSIRGNDIVLCINN